MTTFLKNNLFSLISAKRVVIFLVITIVFNFILFPIPTLAAFEAESPDLEVFDVTDEIIINETLPINDDLKVVRSEYHTITSYNSEVGQCDSTPCITANGFNVCEHGIEDTIAANFLRFGTKVKIPELFGDRVFVVRDRMNKRYNSRVDVWMIEKADSRKFGVQYAKIEILDMSPP